MPGDLHNHSTCSDGSVPIHRLPLMAARAGLDTMAISDHDTLLSVKYCYEHPVQDGVRLLPATELTGYDHELRTDAIPASVASGAVLQAAAQLIHVGASRSALAILPRRQIVNTL